MGVPVNSIFQVTYRGTLLGQTVLTVMHWRNTVVSTIPTIQGEQEAIADVASAGGVDGMFTAYRSVLPNNWSAVSVSVQLVSQNRARRFVKTVVAEGIDEVTTVPNLQASITAVTDLAGRDQIGGMRLPASPANADAGFWTAGYFTKLQAAATDLYSPMTEPIGAGFYVPVVYHRTRPFGQNFDDIKTAFPQRTTRVIRRRTVGVGI